MLRLQYIDHEYSIIKNTFKVKEIPAGPALIPYQITSGNRRGKSKPTWTIAYLFIIFLDSVLIHRNIAINMGATKTDLFTKKQNDIAAMAKAIAHPARIAILQELLKTNACICGELVTELGLAQATISQHLKELKNAGLIQGTIEGTSVCYCIDPKTWNKYRQMFALLFKETDQKNCC
jgi:DNA-binding transcriptional ArsR family regulator